MKILCIQLARLGDILQSAPALHALKREFPDSQIEMLVRPRFKEAAELFSWVSVKTLDTANILGPIIENEDHRESLSRLNQFFYEIREANYDLVLNFSFSPFSSYVTWFATQKQSKGYTRFADGSFAVRDFLSGYFYSQVGVGRANRIHLSDLLSGLAGVTLEQQDWDLFKIQEGAQKPEGNEILIHVGASQTTKSVPLEKWISIVNALQSYGHTQIGLIGSAAEQSVANQIAARVGTKIQNYCGRTSLSGLKDKIARAALVIGADSAPMHFASLSSVPALNLSYSTVNFFETGPRSAQSRILFMNSEVTAQDIASEANGILARQPSQFAVAECTSPIDAYSCPRWVLGTSEWSVIQTAYFRLPFDGKLTDEEKLSLTQVKEINEIYLSQYSQLFKNGSASASVSEFIEQADVLFSVLAKAVPVVGVLYQWVRGSRATVGPSADKKEIITNYKSIHLDLVHILEEVFPSQESYGNTNLPTK